MHPARLRERLRPLFDSNDDGEAISSATEPSAEPDDVALWAELESAHGPVLVRHPGVKGRLVFGFKRLARRSLYWMVDPKVDALARAQRRTVELIEETRRDMQRTHARDDAIAAEVARLRRDLDRLVGTSAADPPGTELPNHP